MLLSIITPYYNSYNYTLKLAMTLIPQLTDEVEWIIVDDGSNEERLDSLGAKVIHLPNNSGNASIPRNVGLDNAQGDYIAFIDSDDLVANNYIEKILNKIKSSDFDYCYISWTFPKGDCIIEEEPPAWNTCVWNCIYKKSTIGDTRFDPKYNMGEDREFNKIVRKGKRENITDILYFYDLSRSNRLSNLYANNVIGELKDLS